MLLIDKFKDTGAAYPLLRAYTGVRAQYVQPTAADEQAAKDLVQALVSYEANETVENLNKVTGLLDRLNLSAHKVTSLNDITLSNKTDQDVEIDISDNILFFHPKDNGKVKGTGQLAFFWRFGASIIPGDSSTYKNPVKPFILSSLHEGTDGAGFMGVSEFVRLKAKMLVANGLHVRSTDIKSPFQAGRNITDGPHSPGVLPIPFLVQALRVNFPASALIVVHGLGRNNPDGVRRRMKLWLINSTSKPFDLTKKSWPALVAIAFAQQDFNFGEISVKSRFEGSFITDSKGVKRNLVSKSSTDTTAVYDYVGGPTSDVQMHIVNNTGSIRLSGIDSGRGVHIEHGQEYQFDGPGLTAEQKKFLTAFNLASDWFIKWDPSVHKFAEMPKDVREFPKWFNEKLKLANDTNEANIKLAQDIKNAKDFLFSQSICTTPCQAPAVVPPVLAATITAKPK